MKEGKWGTRGRGKRNEMRERTTKRRCGLGEGGMDRKNEEETGGSGKEEEGRMRKGK